VAGGVKVESLDGGVCVGRGRPVAIHDLGPGLLGSDPLISLELRIVVPPREALGERSAEDVPDVAGLGVGEMLDQPKKVRAGGGQGTADVVL
jgi:hypothetical protein